jgi:peptidoglycan/LPS O-acetylase OafA/YrhL
MSRLLSNQKLPGLGGLRGIAAGLVVIHHFSGSAIRTGNLGVEIFFVLSGFLITTLLLRESDKTGTVSLLGFYKRRSRRIFPAFYVFWAVTVTLAALRHRLPESGALIATALYFTNYYQSLVNPESGFIVHSWSLAVEEQFYLFWPLLFKSLRTNIRYLSAAVLTLVAIAIVWRASVVLLRADMVWYTYNAFECRMDQLLGGCLLAIALHLRWCSRFFSAMCRSPWLLLATIGGLGLSVLAGADGRWRNGIGFPIEAFLSAILMVQVMWFSSEPWLRWMNSRVADYFANISYPLYLWHAAAGSAAKAILPGQSVIVGTALAVGVATLSYYFVERRFTTRRDRRALPLRPGRFQAAPVPADGQ